MDGSRFLVKGVAYGTFAPNGARGQFPDRPRVASDLAQMARLGINTVRLYSVPPRDLLDDLARHGLRAIVGIPWAQHLAFLDDPQLTLGARRAVVEAVRTMGGHPAVLCFAIGNEIPPGVVRWHGPSRIERFLRDLCDEARQASPDCLMTYVNYPPTEYLDLETFDICAFNVYLHEEQSLRAYLARLQHVAGDRPLLLTEAGADSLREGEQGQAAITARQVRAAFEEGACGAVVFSWTDEWWRGGAAVADWAFGLVTADRRPKPALSAVAEAFRTAPFDEAQQRQWPSVSVVVCAHNAADTIEECLAALGQLRYPKVEVIVVDDGSSDATRDIARRYPFAKLVEVSHGGLSAARNAGLAEATGDVVAYTDADVRVDPDWLIYLVQPLVSSDAVGVGGPNIVPPDDPWMAQCVARAPGGPTCVLLDDRTAEHVAGCNMAFRRSALLDIGGFEPIFLRAGDDVDLCWRLQAGGHTLAYAPSGVVWHRHRATVRGYWRQQVGYGEGETWLKSLHPEKFLGRQAIWHGRIYSQLPFIRALFRTRVNTGVWGTAAFPSVYQLDVDPLAHWPHTARWLGCSLILLAEGMAAWLVSLPQLAATLTVVGGSGLALTVGKCIRYGWGTGVDGLPRIGGCSDRASRFWYHATIAWLHLIQPIARMHGRIRGWVHRPAGTGPARVSSQRPPAALSWRDAGSAVRLLLGGRLEDRFWSESWIEASSLLGRFIDALRSFPATRSVEIDHGWSADRDVSVGIGHWWRLRVKVLGEDHGGGRCLYRVAGRLRPTTPGWSGLAILGLAAVALPAWRPGAWVMALGTGVAMLPLAAWRVARAVAVMRGAMGAVTAQAGMLAMSPKAENPSGALGHERSVSGRMRQARVSLRRGHEPARGRDDAEEAARAASAR